MEERKLSELMELQHALWEQHRDQWDPDVYKRQVEEIAVLSPSRVQVPGIQELLQNRVIPLQGVETLVLPVVVLLLGIHPVADRAVLPVQQEVLPVLLRDLRNLPILMAGRQLVDLHTTIKMESLSPDGRSLTMESRLPVAIIQMAASIM